MLEALGIVGILIVAALTFRSYLIYQRSHPMDKATRNAAPYHYKTPKQQSFSPQNCDKLVIKTTKTTEKP